MPHTVPGTPFDHAAPDSTGVLLVNLGTPDAPTVPAVRRYLAEFLADPRVIEAPRWLWWCALHFVILRVRPPRSARAYRAIWTDEGSPLMVLSRRLATKLGERLRGDSPNLVVDLAMRYGTPSIADALERMRARNLRRILVLPLYPQYSGTTTASVYDRVFEVLSSWRRIPELRLVNDYWSEPAFLDALADSVRTHRARFGAAQKLVFSFHGIPRRYFEAGDPYFCQCQGTAFGVAQRLGLAREDYLVTFQSRVGRERWLEPYTDVTLAALPSQGVTSVDVVSPAFAVDCLETLEEIAIENRKRFIDAGGSEYRYIPALNDQDDHVDALAGVIRRHLSGWPLDVPRAAIEHRARRQAEVAREERG